MSKILSEIRAQLTGVELPKKSRIMKIEKSTKEVAYNRLLEYKITAEFGMTVICEKKNITSAINNVYSRIKHEIYGDLVQRIIDLELALYEDRDEDMRMIMREILREIK